MPSLATQYGRDYYGGALMMLLGVGAVAEGLRYPLGTLSRMGPGFFPTALGAILALIGVAIAAGARHAPAADGDEAAAPPPEWRGWICIAGSIVAFIAIGRWGGFVPATFAITFIAALGDRENTVKDAAILALALVAIGVGVFWWALKLPFALFAWGGP